VVPTVQCTLLVGTVHSRSLVPLFCAVSEYCSFLTVDTYELTLKSYPSTMHGPIIQHPDMMRFGIAAQVFLNLLKLLLYENEGCEGALLSNDNRCRLSHRVGSAFDILMTYSTARFSTGKKAKHCCRRRYSNPSKFVIPCIVSRSVTTLMFCLSAVYLLLVGAKICYSSEHLLIAINLFVLLSGL
jgi:hypothetical protein